MYEMYFTVLIVLIIWHFIADYTLQSEWMAKFKNPDNSTPKAPWYYVLFAHCCTHSLGVFFMTGSVVLTIVELVAHFIIDWIKCDDRISIHTDQFLHILTKAIIAALYVSLFLL